MIKSLMRKVHETCLSQAGGPHTRGTHLLVRGRFHAPVWEPPTCERQVSCARRMRYQERHLE